MAHTEQVNINGILTTARVFDQPAQAIDDAVSRALPGGAIDTDLAMKAPLASPALTGTPTINGVAAANVGQLCNPNLLDNWYFANPVDQRGGYVALPNTTVYMDAALTQSTGVLNQAYRTIVELTSTYGKWVFEGHTYYTAASDCVRGYTGAGYGIDRWYLEGGTVSFANGYYEPLVKGTTIQKISEEKARQLVGKTLTISALTADGLLKSASGIVNPLDQDTIIEAWMDNNNGYVSIRFFANSKSYQIARIYCQQNLLAVKAELGSQQTLAHQENGKWVLNEMPNYAEQLAKCQRYFERVYIPNGFTGYAWKENYIQFNFAYKVKKRTNPSIIVPPMYVVRATDNSGVYGNIVLQTPNDIYASIDSCLLGFGQDQVNAIASGGFAYLSNNRYMHFDIDANL